jgi:hypothetical protein
MVYLTFERRLLRLMFRTNAPLTPVHVAYYLDVPIAEARAHLDQMVSQGILELDSDDGGHLVYTYPLRPAVKELPEPKPPRSKKKKKVAREAMVPSYAPATLSSATLAQTPMAMGPAGAVALAEWEDRRYSPAAAAALSLFLPGVGQIYSGRVPQGIGWMLATGLGYLLFLVPGLILHICCIVNAAAVPTRLPQLCENRALSR